MRSPAWRLSLCCVTVVYVACDLPVLRDHSGPPIRGPPFGQLGFGSSPQLGPPGPGPGYGGPQLGPPGPGPGYGGPQLGPPGPGPGYGGPAHGPDVVGRPLDVAPVPPPTPPPTPARPRQAGAARQLRVTPAPLPASDHELQLNVSWLPPLEGVPKEYSLEVRTITPTADCAASFCYEYEIPGEASWWVMPKSASAVEGAGCALRPACSYAVRLKSHPWDGRTVAALDVTLEECVDKVCSCAHESKLPQPRVHAEYLHAANRPLAVNITWTLPPGVKRGLPPLLLNDHYFVSLGRQLVPSTAGRVGGGGGGGGVAPWFAQEVSGQQRAAGATTGGDGPRWLLLALPAPPARRSQLADNQSGPQRAPPGKGWAKRERLLARVALVDSRGCMGPVGNFTLFDHAEKSELSASVETYVAWGLVWLACALGASGATLLGARRVKRALAACRAPPTAAPTPSPLRRHPAWLPLQCRK